MQCISSCFFFFYLGDWGRMIKAQNFVKNINVLVSNCFIAGGLSGVTLQKSPQECTVYAYTCTLYLFIYLFIYIYYSSNLKVVDSKLASYPAHIGEEKGFFLLPGGLGMRLTTNYPWKHNYIILKPHATVRQDLKALIPVAQTWL